MTGQRRARRRTDRQRSARADVRALPMPAAGRTSVGGFEGSPLDPRYTFDSFVVGPSNRMAHAGATQVAETVLGEAPGFNPLYIHSSVGLGKTHLLHAIAWEVKRRAPNAQVLYLTAERFRYQFVEALRSQDPLAFKEKFRVDQHAADRRSGVHARREDRAGVRPHHQLAARRRPAGGGGLGARARPRSSGSTSACARACSAASSPRSARSTTSCALKVLEKRLAEKRATDPSFELSPRRPRAAGRAADGKRPRARRRRSTASTSPGSTCARRITLDIAETMIRDLVQGIEPRRIKIEDILRIISRHFGVSKGDLLSQRRHRSVVWPRQIGMYLAKQLTARSLPEIGRRFGNRDHTTVLHAIRKIEGEIGGQSAAQGRARGAEEACSATEGRPRLSRHRRLRASAAGFSGEGRRLAAPLLCRSNGADARPDDFARVPPLENRSRHRVKLTGSANPFKTASRWSSAALPSRRGKGRLPPRCGAAAA